MLSNWYESKLRSTGWRPDAQLRWWYVCVLHRGSNCSSSWAMDDHVMCYGIISSCQSAATSEPVKRCWRWVYSCKQRYHKYPDLYLPLTNRVVHGNVSLLKTKLHKNISNLCSSSSAFSTVKCHWLMCVWLCGYVFQSPSHWQTAVHLSVALLRLQGPLQPFSIHNIAAFERKRWSQEG